MFSLPNPSMHENAWRVVPVEPSPCISHDSRSSRFLPPTSESMKMTFFTCLMILEPVAPPLRVFQTKQINNIPCISYNSTKDRVLLPQLPKLSKTETIHAFHLLLQPGAPPPPTLHNWRARQVSMVSKGGAGCAHVHFILSGMRGYARDIRGP